ncbi:MAG: hypothetical protein U0228_12705 [Myxococcaceae bacterium]
MHRKLAVAAVLVVALNSFAQNNRRPRRPAHPPQSPPVQVQAPAPATNPEPAALQRPTRIEMEGSNLTGQLNKAGGVYLYERKELAVRSMVQKPDNFRAAIVSGE